jgi:LysR family transcriptional regulator, glycine cleavage system transcriptional activator
VATVRSPSFVELQAFLAVAKTGTFSKAAEMLCVTQAAVSRSVMRLEQTIGQDVFQRGAAGVRLTSAGQELMQLTEGPVAAIEAATLRLHRRPERRKLRMSVVTSLGYLWLMPRLSSFRELHPDIDLELRQPYPEEDFTRDDVDLWIVVKRSRTATWPRQISARYLIGREVIPVCTPTIAARVRTAQELLSQPLLYHSTHPDNWAVWARKARISLGTASLTTGFDSVMNLVGGASAGLGVALVQCCMIESELRSGVLATPVPIVTSTGRGYYLCRRRSLGAHLAADRFEEWVTAEAGSDA